jgi:hypothetical protein
MLKTEIPKGRMLRRTPEFGGIGRIFSGFHSPQRRKSRTAVKMLGRSGPRGGGVFSRRWRGRISKRRWGVARGARYEARGWLVGRWTVQKVFILERKMN